MRWEDRETGGRESQKTGDWKDDGGYLLMMIVVLSLIGLFGGMIMGSEASGDKIAFYVAQDGNDTNAGTEVEPFATLLLEHANAPGIADDVVIAGVLHDAIEDTDTTLDEIEDLFGTEVRRLVGTASELEDLKKDPNQKGTWRERKLHTIKQLRTLGKPAKILSCCDKLDNARSMNDDYALVGATLWARFNAPKTDTFWYYKECLKAYVNGVSIESSRVFRLLKREVGVLCSH